MYRRCQALEHLGKLEEAFKDIHTLTRIEPKVKYTRINDCLYSCFAVLKLFDNQCAFGAGILMAEQFGPFFITDCNFSQNSSFQVVLRRLGPQLQAKVNILLYCHWYLFSVLNYKFSMKSCDYLIIWYNQRSNNNKNSTQTYRCIGMTSKNGLPLQ